MTGRDAVIEIEPGASVHLEDKSTVASPSAGKPKDQIENYPYIQSIIRLGEKGRLYECLAEKFQLELGLKASTEASPTPAALDENRQERDADTISYAILDFRADGLSSRRFTCVQETGGFIQAVRVCPNDVKTRIILIGLLKPNRRAVGRLFEQGMAMPSALLVEALGSTYDIKPLIFYEMMSSTERRYWKHRLGHRNSADALKEYDWTNELQPSLLRLGFDSATIYRSPRIWVTIEPKCDHRKSSAVIAFYRPSWQTFSAIDNNAFSGDTFSEDISSYGDFSRMIMRNITIPPGISGAFLRTLEDLERLSTDEIHSANQNPMEFLIPLIRPFELYFLGFLTQTQARHRKWLADSNEDSPNMAQSDRFLVDSWKLFRGILEDFQGLSDNISEYQGSLKLVRKLGASPVLKNALKRRSTLLKEGRALEQYIRDNIQINIGSLSLQESRKAIQQADSVGRISFLSFIFIPLSLIMSFFGMNINEITGSGASWRVFIVSTAALCILVMSVCAVIWRKSRTVKFLVQLPLIPLIYPLTLLFEKAGYSGHYIVREEGRGFQLERAKKELWGIVPFVEIFIIAWEENRRTFWDGTKTRRRRNG